MARKVHMMVITHRVLKIAHIKSLSMAAVRRQNNLHDLSGCGQCLEPVQTLCWVNLGFPCHVCISSELQVLRQSLDHLSNLPSTVPLHCKRFRELFSVFHECRAIPTNSISKLFRFFLQQHHDTQQMLIISTKLNIANKSK